MSRLLPIARHGALVYNTWCQIGKLSPERMLSWQHFSVLFSDALSKYVEVNSDVPKAVSAGEDKTVCREVISQLNQMMLQQAFRSVYIAC
jgi:hypothetical protein